MLLNTITAKHPNSFVLLIPKSRDDKNYVRDWEVLSTSKKYNGILKVAEYYRSEGMSNAVILSTSDNLVVKPNEVAKFFRLYYGLLTISGDIENSKVDDNTCSSDEDTPVSDDKDINTNGDGGCESGAGQDTGISA